MTNRYNCLDKDLPCIHYCTVDIFNHHNLNHGTKAIMCPPVIDCADVTSLGCDGSLGRWLQSFV